MTPRKRADGVRLMLALLERQNLDVPIYGYGLPTAQAVTEQHPQMPCISIGYAPSRFRQDFSTLRSLRVDVSCWAQGFAQAGDLYNRMSDALYGLERIDIDGFLVHNLQQTAGPLQRIDPEAYWRSVLSTWEIRTEDKYHG